MARTVLITGAASGIGRALAARLANRGDHLVLADVDAPGIEAAAMELGVIAGRRGGSAKAVVLDVRDAQAVQTAVEDVVARHGRIDIIVNNAGIGLGGAAEEMSAAHWQRVLDINLSGVMHGVVAAYPLMVDQGGGQIVNIASLAGLVPAPFLAAYGASKHGVVGLSLSLAAEAKVTGVAVTCVCPGFTDTAILDFHGPADLPPTSAAGKGRQFAEQMPSGLYDVQSLARDIEQAMDRRRVLLVTPSSARWTWRMMRLSPVLGVHLASRVATKTREVLGSLGAGDVDAADRASMAKGTAVTEGQVRRA